jgi:Flp pilus assembly protein TadD
MLPNQTCGPHGNITNLPFPGRIFLEALNTRDSQSDSCPPEVPMAHRPAASILILTATMILALPAKGQQNVNPKNDGAHVAHGMALAKKGDLDGAIAEFREAVRLNPKNENAHLYLGWALTKKGDWDGAIAEYREAQRLNPKNENAQGLLANAHVSLGVELERKGDWDGQIAELREALRLNPNNGNAHFLLGVGLERKGKYEEALGEFRVAHELDPQNPAFREGYERLSKQVNH